MGCYYPVGSGNGRFHYAEVEGILCAAREVDGVSLSPGNVLGPEYAALHAVFHFLQVHPERFQYAASVVVGVAEYPEKDMVRGNGLVSRPHCFLLGVGQDSEHLL